MKASFHFEDVPPLPDERPKAEWREIGVLRGIAIALVAVLCIYLAIGFCRLAAIASGCNVEPIAFLDAPWLWLFPLIVK